MKTSRARWTLGMFAIIRCRMFCLPVYCPGIIGYDIHNYNLASYFVWVESFVSHIEGGMLA